MTSTQRYFDRRARAFDRLYAGGAFRTYLREGPQRGRDVATAVVAEHGAPAVLDLGCGPGRVAEAVLGAGATTYVGVDVSPVMLELAGDRVGANPRVELVQGNFVELELARSFDVVLALGVFDYLGDAQRAARWMRARCNSTLVASFTCWDWVKAPFRHAHYELLHRCPVFDYTEPQARELLTAAGFSSIEAVTGGRRGFVLRATVAGEARR